MKDCPFWNVSRREGVKEVAVVKIPQTARLVIKVQIGTDENGKPVYRSRTYQNLNPLAADADVHAVGQALASLQIHPVNAIMRVDEGSLLEE